MIYGTYGFKIGNNFGFCEYDYSQSNAPLDPNNYHYRMCTDALRNGLKSFISHNIDMAPSVVALFNVKGQVFDSNIQELATLYHQGDMKNLAYTAMRNLLINEINPVIVDTFFNYIPSKERPLAALCQIYNPCSLYMSVTCRDVEMTQRPPIMVPYFRNGGMPMESHFREPAEISMNIEGLVFLYKNHKALNRINRMRLFK